MDDGKDGPSERPPEDRDKGKGKGKDKAVYATTSSLMRDMMHTARSSVTPSNLSSLMASNGKTAGMNAPSDIPEQTFDYSHASPLYTTTPRTFHSNGLHKATTDLQNSNNDEAYRQFAEMGSSRLDLGIGEALQSSSPVFVGPYSSAQSLDAALHDQVRASSSHWNDMDEVWNDHSQSQTGPAEDIDTTRDTSYDAAWARTLPSMATNRLHDMQRGANIDQLLQTVSLTDHASTFAPSVQSRDFLNSLEDEERQEQVYHLDDNDMSEEQSAMHRDLHQVQHSRDRANEKIRPPDDDAIARTGVYASTPEEALKAIWDGPSEGERASSLVRTSQEADRSNTITKKIREMLNRGSYVDDVYGIPPQLQKTIVAAEEPETEENRDRRAKAISRLDALYRHLGATSTPDGSIDDFVRNW